MIIPLAIGYIADLLLGDPQGWPHPVRLFGWAIHKGDNYLNKGRLRLLKGALLTLTGCAAVYADAAGPRVTIDPSVVQNMGVRTAKVTNRNRCWYPGGLGDRGSNGQGHRVRAGRRARSSPRTGSGPAA